MSGGTGVVAGPEVDMVELVDGASSSAAVANAVDLDLNLIPPPAPCDGLALELALGGHDSEGSVQVSRQNWPRFEPGMSGLLLVGAQEDEVPAAPEGRPHRRNLVSVTVRRQPTDRIEESTSPSRVPSQESGSGHRDIDSSVGDLSRGDLAFSVLRQRLLRSSRYSRHLRRSRQTLVSALGQLETPPPSGVGPMTEAPFVDSEDFRPSSAMFPMSENRRNQGTATACVDTSSGKNGVSILDSKQGDAKEAEVGHGGAHFECNICLEMATEPVVTCCGHLFCWPCLYQWLHVHCVQKECPVCKGSLSDNDITPIYGRGNVEDTEKSLGNTPPRPHAHRLSNKRCRQERVPLERIGGHVRETAGSGRSVVEIERSEPEGSIAILNRLRVVQRLQLDERFRMRQRMMGRQGSFRSPSTVGAASQVSPNPIQLGTADSEQYNREQLLTRMATNRLETADNLAVIRARIDGLRENLASYMQRSVQVANMLPRQVRTHESEEGINSASPDLAEPLYGEERMPTPGTEIDSRPLPTNVDEQPQQDSADLRQSSWREWQRTVSGASGSLDIEPGSLHARKRRRLN